MAWNTLYPITWLPVSAGGDTTSQSVAKHILELARIYSVLSTDIAPIAHSHTLTDISNLDTLSITAIQISDPLSLVPPTGVTFCFTYPDESPKQSHVYQLQSAKTATYISCYCPDPITFTVEFWDDALLASFTAGPGLTYYNMTDHDLTAYEWVYVRLIGATSATQVSVVVKMEAVS